jgi:hypothetical protein
MVIDRVICDAQETNNAAEEATALDAGKAQNKSSTNVKAGESESRAFLDVCSR